MADTIDDDRISNTSWVSANALSGIAVGTALVIQNKGSDTVIVNISSSQPAAASNNGPVMYSAPYQPNLVSIDSGENEVWLKASGSQEGLVNIQEND